MRTIASVMALRSVGRAVYWYDRSVARFGLEARHPFLDRRLAEFLLAIPGEQLYRGGRSKWLLRRAMDGILPGPVLERRDKTRFGSYLGLGLREREAQQVATLLEAPALAQWGSSTPADCSGRTGITGREKGIQKRGCCCGFLSPWSCGCGGIS